MVARENTETSRQEAETLRSQVDDLQARLDDMQKLLSLKDEQLARLQDRVVTGEGEVAVAGDVIEQAVEAMRRGAEDYIQKPFDTGVLRRTVQRNIERTRVARKQKNAVRQLAELVCLGLWGGLGQVATSQSQRVGFEGLQAREGSPQDEP